MFLKSINLFFLITLLLISGNSVCSESKVSAEKLNHDDEERLIYDAKIGNLDAVNEALEKGVNVHWQNAKGETALIVAAREGHDPIVKRLLQISSLQQNIDAPDNKGHKLLYYALTKNDCWVGSNPKVKNPVVKTILNHTNEEPLIPGDLKDDIHLYSRAFKERMIGGIYGSGLYKVFLIHKKIGLPLDVARLIARYTVGPFQDAVTERKIKGAISNDNIKHLKKIITPMTIESVDEDGRTPLVVAIREKKPEMVTWLLSQGANIDAVEDYKKRHYLYDCECQMLIELEFYKRKAVLVKKEMVQYPTAKKTKDQILEDLTILIRANDRSGVAAYLDNYKGIEVENKFIPAYSLENTQGESLLRIAIHSRTQFPNGERYLDIAEDLIKRGATLVSREDFDSEYEDYKSLIQLLSEKALYRH